MSKQNLTSLRITGNPTSSVLALLPVGNMHEANIVKVMFSTKCFHTAYVILSSIGGCNNQDFHILSMGSSQLFAVLERKFLTKMRLPDFLNMFRRESSPKTVGIANVASMQLGTNFRRKLFAKAIGVAKSSNAQFFAGFRRSFTAQAGASNAVDIKAFVTEWLELIKPVLLSHSQEIGDKDNLQDFKDESVRTVLIPGILQLGIAVNIALKTAAMLIPALVKVSGTTNIELVGNGACDAVNARCVGDAFVVKWGHSNEPPIQVCCLDAVSASNTGGINKFPHYYTTPIRSLSSFIGGALCLK